MPYEKLRVNQGNCLPEKIITSLTERSSAQAWGSYFHGESSTSFIRSSAQTPGQAEPVFTRPRVLRFRLRAARLLIAIRPDSPLRAQTVGLGGDR